MGGDSLQEKRGRGLIDCEKQLCVHLCALFHTQICHTAKAQVQSCVDD